MRIKNTLTNIALLVSITMLSLVGCSSTNTQQQNTGIGAVGGAVLGGLAGSLFGGGSGKVVAIGIGAVAGALLGGYVGHNMDSSDSASMNSAMNNRTNQSTTWTNNKTGAKYTFTPVSDPMVYHGNNYCRKFYTTAVVNGKTSSARGIACKQANGQWAAVK